MATSTGLRRAYTVWATFYDVVVRFLRGSRRRSFALLDKFWNRPAPPPLPLRIANAVLLHLLRKPGNP